MTYLIIYLKTYTEELRRKNKEGAHLAVPPQEEVALVKPVLLPGPEAGLPQNHAATLQHGTPSGSRGNSPGHVTATATSPQLPLRIGLEHLSTRPIVDK